MRAFFDFVEAGRLYLPAGELAPLGDALLSALRVAGVVRDEDPGMLEVSAPDLARLLRTLHGAIARGTPVPSTLDARPVVLGWIPEATGERELVLVARPAYGLAPALTRTRPARVLIPTARGLSPLLRAAHEPGSLVEIEALEETLVLRRGRLARAGAGEPRAKVRSPAGDGSIAAVQAFAPAPPRLPGAARWEDVRICFVEKNLVRIDVAGRSFRCTPYDLGMAHPRSRKATRVWDALVELCDHKGVFKTRAFGGVNATKKLVSRLRARLRALFGLAQSPFYRYRTGQGWRVRFTARPDLPGEDPDDRKERILRALRDKSLRKSS